MAKLNKKTFNKNVTVMSLLFNKVLLISGFQESDTMGILHLMNQAAMVHLKPVQFNYQKALLRQMLDFSRKENIFLTVLQRQEFSTILKAKKHVLLATGAAKSDAVHQAFGAISSDCPASYLKETDCHFYVDFD
uniref:Glucosamine-6-phosphate isomerase n=1 Tax=Spironucleus salmonicida TaxID=348837 RepID=V6LV34_9EUKA|eukprot:EST48113.1 Glucosamine-6-phosphate isomerase [Spironucleus salmonicida]